MVANVRELGLDKFTTEDKVALVNDLLADVVAKYKKHKPPTTNKPPYTKSLNQAIFISESAAMTCPQTVLSIGWHLANLLHHTSGT